MEKSELHPQMQIASSTEPATGPVNSEAIEISL